MKSLLSGLLIIVIGLSGCNNLERLVGGDPNIPRRDSIYDTSPVGVIVEPQEPYASKAGVHVWPDGSWEQLYLIHWKGNSLDNTSHLESEIDILVIPKI